MANGTNDTRIVQMQFDNKDFEKNISTSQKSLEKFKKELNFDEASKGMDEFSKSLKKADGFDKLADGIQKLTDKFTGLGTASEYVLSRVRRTLESMGDQVMSFVNSLTTVQMQAGFVKYESLNKSVQTLKSATHKEEQEIYAVLERLTKYTDETSYDFAQGVTSISQLVSSGAAGLEQAEKVVEGFYNFAAKAGADTQKASAALQYSMVQAMQRGYLDWSNAKELSSKSLLTSDFKEQLLETAVALGTVTKEGDKYYAISKKSKKQKKVEVNTTNLFNDSLQHQWVTTKVLNATLEKYADTNTEFGKEAYAAAQRCTTFTDALNAWKDMLATGWMQTYRTVFGDLSEAMELFSGICNKVSDALSGLSDARNKMLKSWKGEGGKDSLWAMLVGEFTSPEGQVINEGKKGILDIITGFGDTISDAFWEMVKNSMNESERSQLEMWANNTDAVLQMMEAEGLLDGATEEELEQLREYISENFGERSLLQAYLGSKLADATKSIQEFVQSVYEWMNTVNESTGKTRFQQLQETISGIFSAIRMGAKVIGGVFYFISLIASQLEPSINAIIGLLEKLGLHLTDTAKDADESGGIAKFFENLAVALQPLTDAINNVITNVATLIGNFIDWGKESGAFEAIWNGIASIITAVGEIVSKVSGPVLRFIGALAEILGDLFKNGFDEKSLSAAGKKLEDAFNNLFDGLFGIIPGLEETIKKFFGYIFGFADDAAEDETKGGGVFTFIKRFFKGGSDGLRSFFTDLTESFKGLTLFDFVKKLLGGGLIGSFFRDFSNFVKGTNIYGLIMSFLGAFSLIKLISLLKNMGGIAKGLREGLGGISEALSKGLQIKFGDKVEGTGDKFQKIATGIALIAGAIVILGSMNWQSVLQGVIAVGAIMGALALFVWGMGKLINKIGLKDMLKLVTAVLSIGASIVMLSVGIWILIRALKPLAQMKPDEYLQAIVGLLSILGSLALFAVLMKGLKVGAGSMAAIGLLSIGIGILILALKPLTKWNDQECMRGLLGLMAILAELVIFTKLMSGLTLKGSGLGQVALLAIGIGILMLSLTPLANMEWPNMAKMGAGLAAILLMLVGFTKMISKLTLKGAGMGGVILLALGIVVLVQALMPLASMDWGSLAKMGVGLLAILTMIHFFNDGLGSMRFTEMAGMIAIAASIWVLVQALLPLSKVEWDEMAKMGVGLLGIVLIFAMLSRVMKTVSFMEAAGSAVEMLSLAVVLLAFGHAIKSAGSLNMEQMLTFVAGFGLVMLEFTLLASILNQSTSFTKGAGVLASLLGFVAVMVAFSFALNEVKSVKWETIAAFAGGLSVMMLALAVALPALGTIPIGTAIKGILVLGVALVALTGVLGLVGAVAAAIGSGLADSFKAVVDKMVLVAGSISDFATAMGNVSDGGLDSAASKIGKMMDIIRSLSGAGSYYSDISTFADELLLLGTGAGLFQYTTSSVEDPESSNAFKMIHALLDLSEDLKSFKGFDAAVDFFALGESLALFEEATKDITSEDPPALRLLGKLSDTSSGLNSLSTLDTGKLQENLAGLGGALSLYAMGAKEAGGLTDAEVPDISKAVELIQGVIASLGENGGVILPDLPAEGELTGFGTQLATLGNALTLFANSTNDLDEKKSKNALKVLDFMSDLKSKLTADTLSVITALGKEGVNFVTLTKFGLEISALGTALGKFKDSTSDLGDMSTAESALTFFEGLKARLEAAKLKETIGYFDSNGIDEGALSSFGVQIAALGNSLGSFATSVNFSRDVNGNIVEDKVNDFTAAISALDALQQIQDKLPTVGGIVSWFTGDKMDFSRFATNIGDLGRGLATFSTYLQGVDSEGLKSFDASGVETALNSLASMADIMVSLGQITGEAALRDGYSYAAQLAEFAQYLSESIDKTDLGGGVHTYGPVVDNIAYFMSSLSDAVGEYGDIDPNAISMFKTVAEGLQALVNANVDPTLDFKVLGARIPTEIGGGITEGQSTLLEAAKAVLAAAAAVENYDFAPFNTVGSNIDAGIAQGISDNTAVVEAAARAVVAAAVVAANSEAEINSPSRVFAVIGGYMSQGMAVGITEGETDVKNAASGVIDGVVETTTSAMATFAALMSQEIDSNPVITPVLDLSNIQAGAGFIDGVLGGTRGINLATGIGGDYAQTAVPRSGRSTGEYQGTDLSGINSRLNSLSAQLNNLGNQIGNLQIVMDSGAVVGSISPGVSRNIGQKSTYNRRHNA